MTVQLFILTLSLQINTCVLWQSCQHIRSSTQFTTYDFCLLLLNFANRWTLSGLIWIIQTVLNSKLVPEMIFVKANSKPNQQKTKMHAESPIMQRVVRALTFDPSQLTCQKRFDCSNAILSSSATFLCTSYKLW